jgi:hypothetical protein
MSDSETPTTLFSVFYFAGNCSRAQTCRQAVWMFEYRCVAYLANKCGWKPLPQGADALLACGDERRIQHALVLPRAIRPLHLQPHFDDVDRHGGWLWTGRVRKETLKVGHWKIFRQRQRLDQRRGRNGIKQVRLSQGVESRESEWETGTAYAYACVTELHRRRF